MVNITRNIFNKKKLNSILNNISIESLTEHTILSDIKKIIKNWRILTDKKGTNEISLQDSFLSDFFGKILDYKYINESPNEWHLYREKKTDADATRSDGALGFFMSENEDVRSVIELKSAKTPLDAKQRRKNANYTPVEQAFLYANKFGRKCRWVIVSNYKEIRLYNSASMNEYESFKIFDLTDEAILKKFLYLFLRKNLIEKENKSEIDKLYESNEAEQEKISKEFYAKYKNLRLHLFEHLKEKNKDYNDLILLEKTQKLLDRFIFICYCEDFNLLPERIFKKSMEAVKSPVMFVEITQWDQLKSFFRAIDKGSHPHNINKFDGGLFEFDEILDEKLIISDEIFNNFIEITDYDFNSDLNVNILGHIFEQSITDIEEIKSSIDGKSFDKKRGKRKKDGIYYTPEYITRYIVEQAVAEWLKDRKSKLGYDKLSDLTDEDFNSVQYYKDKKKSGIIKSSNQNIKDHLKFWLSYKEKVSNIKILDPACGSGAFLNQAFDFLYKEGQHVNEEIARLQKGQGEVFRLDEHILKNNLFGVDINPESVEITKLSLWIKTADRRSELTSLDDNIKCGNSLIDDPDVAGERAFKWEDEFADVMQRGGFDVVIGNPPYVRADIDNPDYQKQRRWMEKSGQYETLYEKWDLMIPFTEKALNLLKKYGHFSFIVSNSITTSKYSFKLLDWILENFYLKRVDYFEKIEVFERVGVMPVILSIKKTRQKEETLKIVRKKTFDSVFIKNISQKEIERIGKKVFKKGYIDLKVKVESIKLGDICYISVGMVINADEKLIKGEFAKDDLISFIKTKINTKPFVEGKDLKRYRIEEIKFLEWNTDRAPHKLRRSTFPELYEGDKILRGRVTEGVFDNTGIVCNDGIVIFKKVCDLKGVENNSIRNSISKNNSLSREELEKISEKFDLKYILAVLNSKYANKYLNNNRRHRLVNYFYPDDFRKLPIPKISTQEQQPFIEKADIMLLKNKQLSEIKSDFFNFIKSELKPKKITKKLENWNELNWDDFKKELLKCKSELKDLSLEKRKEWHEYFLQQKKQPIKIKAIIQKTDKKIDKMVYKLYGLTEEEIKIVENSAAKKNLK
jgi:hypothetical protein